MTKELNGAEYRVKAKHPRRDAPLRITGADGRLIAASGDSCANASQDDLQSMLRNGYIERIEHAARATQKAEPAALNIGEPSDPEPRWRSGRVDIAADVKGEG